MAAVIYICLASVSNAMLITAYFGYKSVRKNPRRRTPEGELLLTQFPTIPVVVPWVVFMVMF
jgi:hypothetical protein